MVKVSTSVDLTLLICFLGFRSLTISTGTNLAVLDQYRGFDSQWLIQFGPRKAGQMEKKITLYMEIDT